MTIPAESPGRGASLMPGEERRRSQRVIIRVPITLEMVKVGREIKVSATTVAVNVHGAMVLSPRPLDAQTRLVVVNERTHERAGARVTRSSRESSEGFLTPIEFDKPAPEFWQIMFPSVSWKPEA